MWITLVVLVVVFPGSLIHGDLRVRVSPQLSLPEDLQEKAKHEGPKFMAKIEEVC